MEILLSLLQDPGNRAQLHANFGELFLVERKLGISNTLNPDEVVTGIARRISHDAIFEIPSVQKRPDEEVVDLASRRPTGRIDGGQSLSKLFVLTPVRGERFRTRIRQSIDPFGRPRGTDVAIDHDKLGVLRGRDPIGRIQGQGRRESHPRGSHELAQRLCHLRSRT